MYKGSSVGSAITYVMCGYLIAMFNWEIVFYVSGGLGLFWYICWTLFVYDTPAKHPTISNKERTYIEECIGKTVHTRSNPVRNIVIRAVKRNCNIYVYIIIILIQSIAIYFIINEFLVFMISDKKTLNMTCERMVFYNCALDGFR